MPRDITVAAWGVKARSADVIGGKAHAAVLDAPQARPAARAVEDRTAARALGRRTPGQRRLAVGLGERLELAAAPGGGVATARGHAVQRCQHGRAQGDAAADEGVERGRDFAAKLSMRVLSRMWQMLLKGITEVQAATRPAAA